MNEQIVASTSSPEMEKKKKILLIISFLLGIIFLIVGIVELSSPKKQEIYISWNSSRSFWLEDTTEFEASFDVDNVSNGYIYLSGGSNVWLEDESGSVVGISLVDSYAYGPDGYRYGAVYRVHFNGNEQYKLCFTSSSENVRIYLSSTAP